VEETARTKGRLGSSVSRADTSPPSWRGSGKPCPRWPGKSGRKSGLVAWKGRKYILDPFSTCSDCCIPEPKVRSHAALALSVQSAGQSH
jgi:hypothetical protein